MNMKYLVFGVLGVLFLGVIVTIVIPNADEVEQREVQVIQYEDTRTRMQDIEAAGKDGRTYEISATYRLYSMAHEDDLVRKICARQIAKVVRETVAQNKGVSQVQEAVTENLNALAYETKFNYTCSVSDPWVTTVG